MNKRGNSAKYSVAPAYHREWNRRNADMDKPRCVLPPDRGWGANLAAWDRAYTPSTCVPSVEPFLNDYAERSAAARRLLPWRAWSYGPTLAERLHFFSALGPAAPLLVFIHGGFWQELSEAESSFAAPDLVARGAAFAALGYGLAPEHRLDEIVAMVRRGVLWLRRHAAALGVDPERIVLAGSSAGAHLAAMCLVEGWLPPPLRVRDLACAAVLLSGIYELEPLCHTSIGQGIGLSAGEAARNSPARLVHPGMPALLVARGDNETVAFADQQEHFVAALARAGERVDDLVIPGRNHFDLPLGLGVAADPLGRAVLAHLGLTADIRVAGTSAESPCAPS